MTLPFALAMLLSGSSPTEIHVDVSALEPYKTDLTGIVLEDHLAELYPVLAQILVKAGVPIATPTDPVERDLLEIHKIPSSAAGEKPTILRVHVFSPDSSKAFVYRVVFEVERPDGHRDTGRVLECGPQCFPEEKLAPFLDEHSEELLALLTEPEPPEATPLPAAPPPVSSAPPSTPPSEGTPPLRIRPLAAAGIPIAAFGLAGTIGAAVVLGLDGGNAWDSSGNEEMLRRAAQPETYAVLGTGIALLAAGATMIAVDLVMQRKQPERWTLTPTLGGISGRF